ncbi:MAG: outer membrane beta-barrel protein, partial [Bacteroidota bacterium]
LKNKKIKNMYLRHLYFKILIAALLLLVSLPIFSQDNFLQGTIIKQSGEELSGLINYKNWERNPKKIAFKQTAKGAVEQYTPKEIKQFEVSDELYVGVNVEVEVSSDKIKNMTTDYELMLESKDVFLQIMIQGKRSLYRYVDSNGKNLFYIQEDGTYQLLGHKRYRKLRGGNKTIVENKTYVSQLSKYLGGCPSVQRKLSKTKYNRKDLEKLFLFYHDCTSEDILFQKKNEKIRVNFGLTVGAASTHLLIKDNSFAFYYLTQPDIDPSSSIVGGVSMDIYTPRQFRKWSAHLELLYASHDYQARYEDTDSFSDYRFEDVELKLSYLKFNKLVRYNQPVGKRTKLHIEAGISSGFLLRHSFSRSIERKLGNNPVEMFDANVFDADNNPRNYEFGGLMGLGVQWNKFSTTLRYELTTGFSPYNNLEDSTRSIFLMVRYVF